MFRLFCDLDGVLGDFVGAAGALHGFCPSRVTQWDFYPQVGVPSGRFWEKIHNYGAKFWEEIEPYPWCQELYHLCLSAGPTVVLTSPSDHPSCPQGKSAWLKKHLSIGPSGYLMGSSKEFLAGPRSLLIDDSDANCERFLECGGRTILFPQPWNANRDISDKMSYVKEQLAEMEAALR